MVVLQSTSLAVRTNLAEAEGLVGTPNSQVYMKAAGNSSLKALRTRESQKQGRPPPNHQIFLEHASPLAKEILNLSAIDLPFLLYQQRHLALAPYAKLFQPTPQHASLL